MAGRNETTMAATLTKEQVLQKMAGHVARNAAKEKGTTSEHYIAGYTDAVATLARHPQPRDISMITAMDQELTAEEEKAKAELLAGLQQKPQEGD